MSSERDLKALDWAFSRGIAHTLRDEPAWHYSLIDFSKGWDQAMQSEEVNKLREENLIMREALEFYSKEENQVGSIWGPTGPWDYSAVDIDRGKKAREALAAVGVNTEGLEKVK